LLIHDGGSLSARRKYTRRPRTASNATKIQSTTTWPPDVEALRPIASATKKQIVVPTIVEMIAPET
jgi:hypothetical protein